MEKPPTPVSKSSTPTLPGSSGVKIPPVPPAMHPPNPSPYALARGVTDPFNAASPYARPNMVSFINIID